MSHAQCLFSRSTHFFLTLAHAHAKIYTHFLETRTHTHTHTHAHAIIHAQEEIEPEDMSLADATHISEMTQRSINEKGVKEVCACTHRAHTPARKSTHAYTSVVNILSFHLRISGSMCVMHAKVHIYACICMHICLSVNTYF